MMKTQLNNSAATQGGAGFDQQAAVCPVFPLKNVQNTQPEISTGTAVQPRVGEVLFDLARFMAYAG